jgi:hypothetical protein
VGYTPGVSLGSLGSQVLLPMGELEEGAGLGFPGRQLGSMNVISVFWGLVEITESLSLSNVKSRAWRLDRFPGTLRPQELLGSGCQQRGKVQESRV